MKTEIKYVVGDATVPVGSGNRVIVHCCNDVNAWGAGFVLALSRRWKKPELEYRKWFLEKKQPKLGDVQFVRVDSDETISINVTDGLWVANMICQHGVGWSNNEPPIRYEAIAKCLGQVQAFCKLNNASVHAPRFGAGLAGGSWKIIESIIKAQLVEQGVEVTVYDLA